MKDVDSEMELRDAFRVLDNDGAPKLPLPCVACSSHPHTSMAAAPFSCDGAVRAHPLRAHPSAGLGYITCKEMTTICRVLGEDLDEIEVRRAPGPSAPEILPTIHRRAAHARRSPPHTGP